MTWTQPICAACWTSREPGRTPVRVAEPEVERCAFCGVDTLFGCYVRADPTTVPYPSGEPEGVVEP